MFANIIQFRNINKIETPKKVIPVHWNNFFKNHHSLKNRKYKFV